MKHEWSNWVVVRIMGATGWYDLVAQTRYHHCTHCHERMVELRPISRNADSWRPAGNPFADRWQGPIFLELDAPEAGRWNGWLRRMRATMWPAWIRHHDGYDGLVTYGLFVEGPINESTTAGYEASSPATAHSEDDAYAQPRG
jgi:hypothetical protein